ncbi:mannose-1-phosphate guanylyltransferase/mannose-6-phosphate isomerase [Limnohabitans sp. JirII-29]|uniref:mannose-1-phosphate guanylyltransferase/mannose-6-phosphate isomerase n=1 Tax=Limnohabitans sp. JirII-29 TaxID=1835756 RepID=UPI000D380E13|nr:mannose-1-phosphate guanylyltransferase/mannose-6-phosphate isomerase [Limnohabitans sp. JirII-29]
MSTLIPVVLSGGSGSRLWPLSRALRPKQFLSITDEATLFQLTLQRLQGIQGDGEAMCPIVVANDDHRFLVGEQCREVGVTPLAILLEPVARNTAPAIAAAAFAAQALAAADTGDDPVLLVLPSDHVFSNVPAFHHAVRVGLQAAHAGALVTFGIVPTHAETGYGYVQAREPLNANQAVPVSRFVEKPDLLTAQAYVDDGSYTWNSGMFMFKASVFLQELAKTDAAMHKACEAAWTDAKKDLEFVRLDKAAFASSPSNSVDYAVMEKTDKAVVVPLDAGWNDVGAWSAVWQVLPQDAQGNAQRGDVVLEGTTGSYVHADSRLVTLIGVQDLVVVETSDAVLVVHKDKTQDVKKVVDQLKASKRPETEQHREVFRPWGSYDSVDQGGRFQVKRIKVNPGAKLSLQMHHHRAEHWVVVTGTAKVRLGDDYRLVTENESVYIPVGTVHSLENPGKVPLHLIEVQSGSYLGEDDIVRMEDLYGRL